MKAASRNSGVLRGFVAKTGIKPFKCHERPS